MGGHAADPFMVQGKICEMVIMTIKGWWVAVVGACLFWAMVCERLFSYRWGMLHGFPCTLEHITEAAAGAY